MEPTIDKLSDYLDGQLPEEEADDLRAHIAGCADCRRRLRLLQATAAVSRPDEERIAGIVDAVKAHVATAPKWQSDGSRTINEPTINNKADRPVPQQPTPTAKGRQDMEPKKKRRVRRWVIRGAVASAALVAFAVIAIPNFLEPQRRSADARARADMRSIASGLSAPLPFAANIGYLDTDAITPKPVAEREMDPMALEESRWGDDGFNTEAYDHIVENAFLRTLDNPLSTFSIDVDTASYSNMRRFINENRLPHKGAVRIEEMINYFSYDYPQPEGDEPFSVNVDIVGCPWDDSHRLVRVGLKGREIVMEERPPANLVFLLDVSGSMNTQNKLPLVKRSMRMLLDTLNDRDRVAIAVYAGAAGLVLPSTPCDERATIMKALDSLSAGGSTNGGEGIQLAYNVARDAFIEGGVNRVLLATDGDLNVGITDQSQLTDLITESAKSGVFLSVLGFGTGNYKDSTLEKLADKGNGNYAYIDTIHEARKALVDGVSGTLVTIAKDVKIQIEFNPARVGAWRLIGYENRVMVAEDFNDDKKDAGEIGAGHTVTALYEIATPGSEPETPSVDPLKYQKQPEKDDVAIVDSPESLTVKLRHKQPDGDTSEFTEVAVVDGETSWAEAPGDLKFAAAVASFGMILRDSPNKGSATFDSVLEQAKANIGADKHGYRAEFITLVHKARDIAGGK